jgi:hypothetical protein
MRKNWWTVGLATVPFVLGLCGTAPTIAAVVEVSPSAQQTSPSPGTQSMELVLSGKILLRSGHYMFYSFDTKSMFRIANPSKVRPYKGHEVKLQGKMTSGTGRLYVTKIRQVM